MNKGIDPESLGKLDAEVVNMDEVQQEMENNPHAHSMPTEEEMDVNAIPDLEKLTADILEFLQYVDEPNTQTLMKENYGAFHQKVDEKFPNIPYSITKMLLNEDESQEDKSKNLVRLLEMFSTLDQIKQGKKDIKKEFEDFREGISEEYIYPQFGGKEAFEKAVSEDAAKQGLNRKEKRKLDRKNRKLKKH